MQQNMAKQQAVQQYKSHSLPPQPASRFQISSTFQDFPNNQTHPKKKKVKDFRPGF